ncbi:MAG: ChaN family lipoprotein [Planctomycetes bacterium]|nr:ChaN family lipoprotein [Planctomycetota bacterium]
MALATTPRSPREQLLRIHEGLARRLRREIAEALGPATAELVRYEREYLRGFRRGYRRTLSRRELLGRLSRADLVFQGEYHTLGACQRCALALVAGLASRRRLVLVLDALPARSQRALDAFAAGEINEERLRRAADPRGVLGGAWRGYWALLRLAREGEVQVYGAAQAPGAPAASLREADAFAAEVIARASIAHPGALVYAIAGEHRVAPRHLPAAALARLRREGVERTAAVVHQNVDSIYFQLAREGLERGPSAAEVAPGEHCVLSSTPLEKYHSFLRWELGQEELLASREEPLASWRDERRLVEGAVSRAVRAVARFLGVKPSGLEDFTVYTSADLDFLERLEASGRYTPAEVREVRREIARDESYFLSRGNIIYLSSLSLDHAAEEAAHYVNNKLSGYAPRPLPARTDFYVRVLKEALGFLGSKVLNPSRACHGEEDFREIARLASEERAEPGLERLAVLARLVLLHLELEREALATGRRPRLRALHEQDLDLHLGITHSLGYILGENLYLGLVAGAIDRSTARRLFSLPLAGRDDAETVYFDILRTLAAAGRPAALRTSRTS